jgi:hypothetical protein
MTMQPERELRGRGGGIKEGGTERHKRAGSRQHQPRQGMDHMGARQTGPHMTAGMPATSAEVTGPVCLGRRIQDLKVLRRPLREELIWEFSLNMRDSSMGMMLSWKAHGACSEGGCAGEHTRHTEEKKSREHNPHQGSRRRKQWNGAVLRSGHNETHSTRQQTLEHNRTHTQAHTGTHTQSHSLQ